ncbi:hypothetical protein D3C75_1195510 [compost metagenome]
MYGSMNGILAGSCRAASMAQLYSSAPAMWNRLAKMPFSRLWRSGEESRPQQLNSGGMRNPVRQTCWPSCMLLRGAPPWRNGHP